MVGRILLCTTGAKATTPQCALRWLTGMACLCACNHRGELFELGALEVPEAPEAGEPSPSKQRRQPPPPRRKKKPAQIDVDAEGRPATVLQSGCPLLWASCSEGQHAGHGEWEHVYWLTRVPPLGLRVELMQAGALQHAHGPAEAALLAKPCAAAEIRALLLDREPIKMMRGLAHRQRPVVLAPQRFDVVSLLRCAALPA